MSHNTSFSRVQFTGLVNGWNRDVSLSSFATIPSDATYVILEYVAGAGTGYGFQDSDDTTDFIYTAVDTTSIFRFCKVNATKTIDLYLAVAANAQWYIHAENSHFTALATPASIGAFSGAGTKTIDLGTTSIVPVGAASGCVLIEFNLNMKVGALANLSSQEFPNLTQKNHRLVPLDASRNFYVLSGGAAINAGDIKILAWAPPGCVQFEATFPKINTLSSASTWDGTGFPTVTTNFDFYQAHSTNDSYLRGLRTDGSSYNSQQKLNHRTGWVRPSASGLIQGWRNQAATVFTRYGGLVADTAAANITGVSTFVEGASATVTLSKNVSTFNKLRIVSTIDSHFIDVTSFAMVDASHWTFTVPVITNNVDGVRLGGVTLIATTDTSAVSADFTGTTYSKTDRSSVYLEGVAPSVNIGAIAGVSPAFAVGTQVAFDPAKGSVDVASGIFSGTWVGTQQQEYYDPAAFKWYTYSVVTVSSAIITTIDRLLAGSLSTVTLSSSTYAATSISISDGTVTKTISLSSLGGGVYTFTCPDWVNGSTGLLFGSVSVIATDGTTPTAAFTSVSYTTALSTRVLTSVASGTNYGAIAGFSPALQINSQCRYLNTECKVNADGTLDDNGTGFSGSTVVSDRSPSTQLVRIATVNVPASHVVTSLDSDDSIRVGQIGFTYATTGFSAVSSITTNRTGVTVSNISGVSSGTADLSDRIHGSIYPSIPASTTFTFNDTVGSATRDATVALKTSEVKRVLASPLSTDQTYVGYFLTAAGYTPATGDELYYVPVNNLSIAADTKITIDSPSAFTLWYRVAATGVNYQLTVPMGIVIDIDNDDLVEVGQTPFTFTTSGFSSLTAITTNKPGATVSGITGVSSGTATLADRVNGAVYPSVPATTIFTFTDGFISATRNATIALKTGESKTTLSSPLSTNQNYVGYFLTALGYAPATGDELYYVPVNNLVISPNSLITIDSPAAFTIWYRVAVDGKVHQHTITPGFVTNIDGDDSVKVAQVGFTFTTTGLGPITSIVTDKAGATVGAISGASSGTATLSDRAQDAVYPSIPTTAVFTFSDGFQTASRSATIALKTNEVKTVVVSALSTNNTYLGYFLTAAGYPPANGDEIYYVVVNGLIIDPDTKIHLDSPTTFIAWHRVAATGRVHKYTITPRPSGGGGGNSLGMSPLIMEPF